MSLASLTVQNFRGLRQADLELHPRQNLIHGSNGSGKTSLLEAMFLLGRGRSFRTRNSDRLIGWGEPRLVVFGRTHSAIPVTLGVQVSRREATVAKIGGEFVRSLADLSQALPVQVIEPGVHKLVEEGAFRRRRWLDWAVFHVEHGFMAIWSSYARALKQRNAALRRDVSQVGAWDVEIARLGESLAASRGAVLEKLQPYWHAVAGALGLEVELAYFQGWSRDLTLAEALEKSRERDCARGQTHAGPHRGDVLIRIAGSEGKEPLRGSVPPRLSEPAHPSEGRAGRLARESLSRGQQKLVAVSLILSQLQLLQDILPQPPLLLLDDPAAELDSAHLAAFIAQLAQLRGQLVLTSLTAALSPFGTPDRVFHVERGRVKTV